jgi:hypothetical protein
MFRKLDLCPSSGEEKQKPTLLKPLKSVNRNHLTTNVKVKDL